MKALRWYGKSDVRVEDIAEQEINNNYDVILRITSTAALGYLDMLDGFASGQAE